MSHSTDTLPAFRQGAHAALAALCRATKLVEGGDHPQTTAKYFAQRDAAVAEISRAAGDAPPHAAGAIAVLAEALIVLAQDRSELDYDKWAPDATMTSRQREAGRRKFARMVEQNMERIDERGRAAILAVVEVAEERYAVRLLREKPAQAVPVLQLVSGRQEARP